MVRSGCPGGRASLAVTLPSLKYTLVLVITQNFSLAHILPPRSSVFLQDHALPKPRRGGLFVEKTVPPLPKPRRGSLYCRGPCTPRIPEPDGETYSYPSIHSYQVLGGGHGLLQPCRPYGASEGGHGPLQTGRPDGA